jgi:hypothetical protein
VSPEPLRDPTANGTRGRALAAVDGQRLGRPRGAGAVIASSSGALGAAAIAAKHGSDVATVTVLLATQTWSAVELICRWRLRWRIARLQEDIARKAMEDPANENLRTLLADVASTHLDDLGTRLPIRDDLAKTSPEE